MCIRDSGTCALRARPGAWPAWRVRGAGRWASPVSYTHLTLPTKRVVLISVFAVSLQAEDGIRGRSPSRGLGDVYKRQWYMRASRTTWRMASLARSRRWSLGIPCLLYTSDAADEEGSIDLSFRRLFTSRRRNTR